MATILRSYTAPDGFDVEALLITGQRAVLHFAHGRPADIQAAVDAVEVQMIEAEKPPESTVEVTAENGTIIG